MKKLCLPFVLIFTVLFSFSAHAAGGKLSAASPSGKIGEQIELRVRFDNPGIIATRIFVRYDKSVLRLERAENGDVFADNQALFGKDLTAVPYILLWDDSLATENNTKSGTLFTLRFTVLNGTTNGQTDLKLQVDGGSTFDTKLNPVTVAGCTVAVHVPTVSATTKPTPSTAKPTAATTSTTTKATTTKATKATTTRLTASDATTKPVTASTTQTIPAPVQSQTTPDVPLSAPTDVAQTTTQSGAPEETTTQTSTEPTSEAFTEPMTADATTECAQVIATAPEADSPSRSPLLWLLLLIPVAAILVLLFKKKKH